jgi:hypothetical protein
MAHRPLLALIGAGLLLASAVPCAAQPPPRPPSSASTEAALAPTAVHWDAPVKLGRRWRRVMTSVLEALHELTTLPPPPDLRGDPTDPFSIRQVTSSTVTEGHGWLHFHPVRVTLGADPDGRRIEAQLPGAVVRMPWRVP